MHEGYARFSWVGVLMVIIGVWWLLGELNFVNFEWRFIGPIAVILVGVSMLLGRRRWHGMHEWHERPPPKQPL